MKTTSKLSIQFPDIQGKKVIIAMKGLPSTCKTEIAEHLGQWAKCQVCYIDDFLEAFSLERGYTSDSPPSSEEADRLHRLALGALYRVALRHLQHFDRVVIKSGLCSPFEIDLLIRLANGTDWYTHRIDMIIIVIECQMNNEYRWQSRLGSRPVDEKDVWYKAKSWKDIEKAMDDDDDHHLDSRAWDLYLLSSLKANPICFRRRVTRLVLDPFSDLNVTGSHIYIRLTLYFLEAIQFLLIDQHKYLEELDELDAYKAMQYDELRRRLFEIELRTSRKRSNYLCDSKTTKAGSCVFKYFRVLPSCYACCCGTCGDRVVSGRPAYTCHFCILALHKSCAEKLPFDLSYAERIYFEPVWSRHDPYAPCYTTFSLMHEIREARHACKSCKETGRNYFNDYCDSCFFETQLKCGNFPTIINHDCHQQHFLSLQCLRGNDSSCKACGVTSHGAGSYICHMCNFFYHLECVFLPGEVRHYHGGYEHVMKLVYSHDATEPEDDHWCNICYEDMDPQLWFYSCQECPYYITHASPRCVGKKTVREAISNGNLLIQ